MTTEELNRIANTPGFGTGAVKRDQLAAEAQCRASLPRSDSVAAVQARGDDGGHLVPMAHFGNSSEDDRDWGLYHEGTDNSSDVFGHDARSDAVAVAAIINAYRAGTLVPATAVEAARREEREACAAIADANAKACGPSYGGGLPQKEFREFAAAIRARSEK